MRVIIKPVSTHWMRFNEVPKDDIIVGIAIFTAVTLNPTDKVPRNSVIAIDHLRNPAEFCSGLADCWKSFIGFVVLDRFVSACKLRTPQPVLSEVAGSILRGLPSEIILHSLLYSVSHKAARNCSIGSTSVDLLLDPHHDEHADAQRAVGIGHGDLDRQALGRFDE